MNIKEQLIAQIINIIVAMPIVISAMVYVFQPHLESFVMNIVRHESYAIKYEFATEMLQIFRNIPEENHTPFHRAEIKRLEEAQALLRKKLAANYEANLR